MAVNDPISALEYNNIRSSIAARVGRNVERTEHGIATSTTSSGYGRNFASDVVVGGSIFGTSDTVTEQQYFNLFLDLQAGHVHQFASVNTTNVPADFATGTTIDWDDVVDLNTIATAVSTFNHSTTEFPSANFTTDLLRTAASVSCSSSRNGSTNPWGGASQVQSITHRVTVTFASHEALLWFFAAGGEIRFTASATGGTTATANTKDWDWARILNAMGTIRFGRVAQTNWRTESISPGTGTGSLLTSIASGATPTTVIFEKQGGGVTGGTSGTVPVTQIYDDNFYRIRVSTNAALATATALIFEIEFDDGDAGTGGQLESVNNPIDEPVSATITSNVYTYVPDSEFVIDSVTYPAIQLATPVGTVNSSL